MAAPVRNYGWPSLRVEDWTDTRDTLHMWTQIVGKIRMAHMPMINHWWQVTLYVSPRGLTTAAVPHESGVFDMEFDFINHALVIRRDDGRETSVPLTAKPVAEFYGETLSALDRLGLTTHINPSPNEVDPAIKFGEDYRHASYDGEAARKFWQPLVQSHRVIQEFRSHFRRKGPPGALLLGIVRPGVHTVFGSARTGASRWRTQLWRLGDGGGLLA